MKRFELRNWTITSIRMLLLASFAILTTNCSQSEDEESSPAFSLTVIAEEGGTAASDKTTYREGETVSLSALPDENYRLGAWYEGDEMLSESAEYQFEMPARNMTVRATFIRMEESSEIPSLDDAVDLGLSVRWAPWNVGATALQGCGGLYGWADPTGEKLSTEFGDYPSDTPPADICGTEYDIARMQWGEDWRMPTVEETRELVENCVWEWTEYEGVNGMRVTGPNGNSIFLPAAASRTGETVSNQQGQRGCYWTGTLYDNNSNFAYYLYFYQNNQYGDRNTRRYIGHAVRPVTEQ